MPFKTARIFTPVDAFMHQLTFAKKFSLISTITLFVEDVALFNLFFQRNESTVVSKKEVKGLALIQSLTKNVQTLQHYRSLFRGVLSGVNELSLMQTAKAQKLAESGSGGGQFHMMKLTHVAMYEAKNSGHNQIRFYEGLQHV